MATGLEAGQRLSGHGPALRVHVTTTKRLRELSLSIVHAGHDQGFGRNRLRDRRGAYVAQRA
jgi:hypothetical protein